MSVRVRFAPSPTGYLHVGNVRTALFNWLYARKHGGSFILRIEDTDADRSEKAYEEALIRDLEWLGLNWDEGPGVGGDYGPYYQSQRADLYDDALNKLHDQGDAYRCFCSEAQLKLMRKVQTQRGEPPKYDGRCRHLNPDEAAERAQNEPFSWRFKVSADYGEEVVFEDMIQGRKSFRAEHIGDFILVRSDGSATYPFAVVIDDAGMEMTHVIRGADHMANTARQMLVFHALGYHVPEFAHLPMVLAQGQDAVLSKRTGAASVQQLHADGYLPEAVNNVLALLGWAPEELEEFLPGSKLLEAFTMERVHASPAHYDPNKLNWLNGRYIREQEIGEVIDRLREFCPELKDSPLGEAHPHLNPEAWALAVFDVHREKGDTLVDVAKETRQFLLWKGGLPAESGFDDAAGFLKELSEKLGQIAAADWTEDGLWEMVKETGKAHDRKGKQLFMPLRLALTGVKGGPSLNRLLYLLGPDEAPKRLGA